MYKPLLLTVILVLASATDSSAQGTSTVPADWNVQAATAALDAGALAWDKWDRSQRNLETTCISCHSGGPYLIVRAALRAHTGSIADAEAETNLLADVARRVTRWTEAEPWYTFSDAKKIESLGSESIWNAWILASHDAQRGEPAPRPETRAAFDILWAQQNDRGAWPWLDFDLDPFESKTDEAVGASIALLAVAAAPGEYASTPEIQPALTHAKEYLRAEFARPDHQVHPKTFILWASGETPGLLSDEDRIAFAKRLLALQRNDGGWSLAELGDYLIEPDPVVSDAYATALVLLAIATIDDSAVDSATSRGRAWLITHQDPQTGAWPLQSANKKRDPQTFPSQFMTDAATAYAVLALVRTAE